MQGPQGTSSTGNRGHQGNQGPQGVRGPAGTSNTQGNRGHQGVQGPQGTSSTGNRGHQGVQGPQGPAGGTGAQGPRGYQGYQGPQGSQGPSGKTINIVSGNTSTTYYLVGSSSETGNVSSFYTLGGIAMYGSQIRSSGGFYQSSDERLKIFKDDVNVDFETLKLIPKKYFTWKNGDEQCNVIGTSAQIIQKYYPEIVSEDSDGYLTVNYALLSIISLKAIDKLYDRNLFLENKLKLIEESL